MAEYITGIAMISMGLTLDDTVGMHGGDATGHSHPVR